MALLLIINTPWLAICVVSAVITLLGSYYFLKNRFEQKHNSLLKDVDYLNARLSEQEGLYNSEIRRHNYILDAYKKEQAENNHSPQVNSSVSELKNNSKQLQVLTAEAQKLEDEKVQFQSKNKKLWEQSIAIHKEKERIDLLKTDIEKKHNELTSSIRYAKRIQNALLPNPKYIENYLKNHFILWQPRDIVSGDFYWIKQVDRYTIIVAADCTGHGVPGAFMSMLGIAFLNEITSHSNNIESNKLLNQLRDLVKQALQQQTGSRTPADGMDMAMCVIDNKKNILQFSGANNPLILIRNEELQVVKPTRNPIAIYRKEKPFIATEIKIKKGDMFYIFSDGYIDQFGGDNDLRFTTKRFKELLINIHKQPMTTQKQLLIEHHNNWKKETKQLDDVLVIGFSPELNEAEC